jgi:hypothetical protein
VTAKLKSGMELSLNLLNDLNALLGRSRLSTDQLTALRDPAILSYYNQAARLHVEFRGKSGQTATLWAYPVIRMYEHHFRKVAQVNALGQVSSLTEETIELARPVALHFIGTKST